jgi:hypothetical protein
MRTITSSTYVAAFVSGALAVLSFASWRVDVRAQGGASGTAAAIDACVAIDGALRFLRPPASCDAAERHLLLQTMTAPAQKDSDSATQSLKARIAALERKVIDLEDAASRGELGTTVVEPFEVRNGDGKTIFSVSKTYGEYSAVQVHVNNKDGALAAGIMATDAGGWFFVNSPKLQAGAWFGVQRGHAALEIDENDVTRVQLGRADNNNYRLAIYGADKQAIAGLGQSMAGTGLAFVADHGVMKAQFSLAEHYSGLLKIERSNNEDLVAAGARDYGGGVLQVMSLDGVPMVEAIASAAGYGIVAVGPAGRPTGGGLIGVPGSYIAGKP